MTESEFSELIEQNQGIVWKVCRSYTNNEADSEDLFQEIVLQLWKSHRSFKGDSKFTTWMYRVALNTAISLYRKRKKRGFTTELEDQYIKVAEDSEAQEREEKIGQLYWAIKQLSEIERALTLMYLDEIPYREISETLGISEVNARVKMNRIKGKLKEIMTNE